MRDFLFIIPKYDMSRIMMALPEDIDGKPVSIQSYPFLGVYYLASVLLQKGYRVDILDITASGLDMDGVINKIKSLQPKIIGIYTSSFSLHYTYNLISRIKSISSLPVILGGPHLSGDPASLVTLGADYALIGEAMHTLPVLVQGILDKGKINFDIPNLYVNREGEVLSPDHLSLNSPIAMYSEYEFDSVCSYNYKNPFTDLRSASVIYSLGCPFNCIFCMTSSEVRYRCVDSMIKEIRSLYQRGIRYIQFQDDSFTLRKKEVVGLCDSLKNEGMDLVWNCTTRADLVDFKTFKRIKEAGCDLVKIGVESANPKLRNLVLKKSIKDEDILKAFRMLGDLGFRTCAFFMSGIPGESEEDFKMNYDFINRLQPDFIDYYIAIALPGTELFKKGLNDGKFNLDVWREVIIDNRNLPVYLSDGLGLKRLREVQKRFFYSFYFKPRTIFRQIKNLRGLNQLVHIFSEALQLVKYLFRK